ncbi:MAG: hypothetical protein WC671_00345 [Candidatus Paceibacterota bacterium]|jgi:hypothetical protein
MKTETKPHSTGSVSTTCQNCKEDFVIEPEDFNFYEKMKVPAPTFCPLCRAERRFAFRNERKLFKVKDTFTGKEIFSLYPEESGRKIITQEEWYGDGWDAMEYAREYDFSRPFFEQFFELQREVPIYNLNVQRMINSPYSGNATALKNCYLCFHSNYTEDSMYGSANDHCKDCVDNSHIQYSERCYECFWLEKCYQCYFSIMCGESHNLFLCRNCLGCNDCFGCANLRKSSYCIFNKQYSKENYFKEIESMKLNTIFGLKKMRGKARAFWLTQPTKSQHGLKNLNSTGSHVTHCKNVNDSFLIRGSENMRYCQHMQVPANKDCYDVSNWGENTELSYETLVCGENAYNMKFSFNCWPTCTDSEYCMDLFSCSDCFGCVGLKKKQYCIFNKQYTKEEYYQIIEKIKKQMDDIPYTDKQGLIYKYGEFFPIEFSQSGYNNTVAIQHFPLTKTEAEKKGYLWVEAPQSEYRITIKSSELPNSIPEENEILKEIIECENCKKAYRIMENELIFLRKENLPLPDLCHDCRYDRRIKDRLSIRSYDQSCMCGGTLDETGIYKNTVKHLHADEPCGEKFKTGHAPENKEIVYCEKCYQQEVY